MVKKVQLDNGVRLVYEKNDNVKSISVGIWIAAGSRYENLENNGISHFIEHMMFKSTKHRTAIDIASAIEDVGGSINAFTSNECTCYYTRLLNEHLDLSLNLLSDMILNSLFNEKDIKIEKNIVLEEINMDEDYPEDLINELTAKSIWKNNSLGYSVLGTKKTVKSFNKYMINEMINKTYIPENIVVSVAGLFDEKELISYVNKYFGGIKKQNVNKIELKTPQFNKDYIYKKKDSELTHVNISFEGLELNNQNLFPLMALNNYLGGGMSSVLFQKVREEAGLAYSIYSFPVSYSDTGLLSIYVGANPKDVIKAVDIIFNEIYKISINGINEENLNKYINQFKGNYILGLEGTSSRMNSIGKSELLLKRVREIEDVIKKIEAISLDSINNTIRKVFDLTNVSMATIGKKDIYSSAKKYL